MDNNLLLQLEEKIGLLIEKNNAFSAEKKELEDIIKKYEAENSSLKEEIEKLRYQKDVIKGRIDKLLSRLEDAG